MQSFALCVYKALWLIVVLFCSNSGWILTTTLVLSVMVLLWICCAAVATAVEQYVPPEVSLILTLGLLEARATWITNLSARLTRKIRLCWYRMRDLMGLLWWGWPEWEAQPQWLPLGTGTCVPMGLSTAPSLLLRDWRGLLVLLSKLDVGEGLWSHLKLWIAINTVLETRKPVLILSFSVLVANLNEIMTLFLSN